MESSEQPSDESDGEFDQNLERVTALTLHSDEEKTSQYSIEKTLNNLMASFLNEKIKDDVRFSMNEEYTSEPTIICAKNEENETKYQLMFLVPNESNVNPTSEGIPEITSEALFDPELGKYSLNQYFQLYWRFRLDEKYQDHTMQVVIWTHASFEQIVIDDVLKPCEYEIYISDDSSALKETYQIKELPDDITEMLKRQFVEQFAKPEEITDVSAIENSVVDFCNDLIFYTTKKDRLRNVLSIIGIKTTNPEKKLDHGDFFVNTDDIYSILRYPPKAILHFISESTALSFIKVAQNFKNKESIIKYSALNLDYLLSYNEDIAAVLALVDTFSLVVEIPKDTPFAEYGTKATKVLQIYEQLCMKSEGKKTIALIYNTENKETVNSWISKETLKANTENTRFLSFTFDQLTIDSQKRMKDSKVKFQGQEVPLQELLPTDDIIALNSLINENVMDTKISSGPMIIGNSLPGLTQEVKDCYIKRQFAHCSKISAKTIVDNFKGYKMKLDNLDNSYVDGKSGNGNEFCSIDDLLSSKRQSVRSKSTVTKIVRLYPDKPFNSNAHLVKTLVISTEPALFTKIAEKIKKRNPRNWIIEISLKDHMAALQSQAMSTDDDIIEFLLIAGKSEEKLEKDKLREGLKDTNMHVFLDTIGEFRLDLKSNVVAMVAIMKRTKIQQIYINTNSDSKALFCSDFPDGKVEIEHYREERSTPVFKQIEDTAGSEALMFTWENPDEDSIIRNTEASKIVVICGDPGSGKSISLSNIAIKLKEKYPDYWIIQISLSDHTDFLKKFNVTRKSDEGIIDFLRTAEGLSDDSNDFGKVMLKDRVMKTGKIIVLLDALDEVCPLYEHKVVRIVECMSKRKVHQIWISTRPEFKNFFRTEHCYRLKDFKIQEQERFIKLYLSRLLKLDQKERTQIESSIRNNKSIDTCSVTLFNMIKSTTDSTRLIGNALLARMAVEVYFNNIKESEQSADAEQSFNELDLHNNVKSNNVFVIDHKLYEQFISQRYCFHCEGKWKAKTSSAMLNMENKNNLFSTAYQRYAFKYLFADQFKLFYAPNDELAAILAWDLVAIGIISVSSKNIQFFHRTFAEYFVAQLIAKMLAIHANKPFRAAKKVQFLTFEHLKERNKMIRHFMDHFLSHGSEVHQAVLNDNFEEFLKLVENDKGLTRKRDKLGRTPLHIACSHKRKNIVDYLLKLDASLITDLDSLGFGPVCYAAVKGDEFFLKKMLKAAANFNNGSNEHLRHCLLIYNLNEEP